MIATVDHVEVPKPAQKIIKANPIETLQKTVSASRLNTWLQCRLKFYFRYVQEIPKPKTPALHVGSVVHVVLQPWNMARWRKQAFNRETFKGLFEEGWKDQPPGINWDGEEAGEKNTAWAVLDMYFSQTPIKPNEMPEAVEVPMHDYIIEAMVKALKPVLKNPAKAQQILKRFWTDKMALVWDVQDVHTAANEREVALTNKEAIKVLHELHHYNNKQTGLQWKDVTSYIEENALGRKLTPAELKRFVEKNLLTITRKRR